MPVERLQKILSNAGFASRRTAEELILAGRVTVNGETVTTLGARADTDSDEVNVDGVPVLRGHYRYFLLNKPTGFVTTASDELGRETVLDLVPIGDIQLHAVGRLDADSEGLLILTTDGNLTALLTHPRHEVDKEYLVGIDTPVSQTDIARLVRGIDSDGERLRAVSVRPVRPPAPAHEDEPPPEAPAWLLVTLREGKNRQVRRMLEAVGKRVIVLRRLRLGPLHLADLGSGAFRELTDDEVSALYRAGRPEVASLGPQTGSAPAAASRLAPMSPRAPGRTVGSLRRTPERDGPGDGPPRPSRGRAAAPRPPAEPRGRPAAEPRPERAEARPSRSAPPPWASGPAGRGGDARPGGARPAGSGRPQGGGPRSGSGPGESSGGNRGPAARGSGAGGGQARPGPRSGPSGAGGPFDSRGRPAARPDAPRTGTGRSPSGPANGPRPAAPKQGTPRRRPPKGRP
jgi:23S rRNA pseudouridine2605 synthase